MSDRKRIYNKSTKLNDTDRIELSGLLIKAGYCVKISKEKLAGKKQETYYVEFWEE